MKKLLIFGFLSIFACNDIIEVTDISEETVSVLAPANGVTLDEGDIAFTWNSIEDADDYNVQIATPSFEAATQIVTDSIVSETLLSISLDEGDYEWRVRAENSGYETVYTTQSFTLLPIESVNISNEEVDIIAPANNESFLTTRTISFTWEEVDDASEYTLQIATPDFDNPIEVIENETISSTNFSVSNLEENDYEFRVKAKNSGYETEYTEVRFIVETP